MMVNFYAICVLSVFFGSWELRAKPFVFAFQCCFMPISYLLTSVNKLGNFCRIIWNYYYEVNFREYKDWPPSRKICLLDFYYDMKNVWNIFLVTPCISSSGLPLLIHHTWRTSTDHYVWGRARHVSSLARLLSFLE